MPHYVAYNASLRIFYGQNNNYLLEPHDVVDRVRRIDVESAGWTKKAGRGWQQNILGAHGMQSRSGTGFAQRQIIDAASAV